MTPQALAVKIFALMPVSMVKERAVSVTTWINSAKRSRQSVATVSNHLQIRQFEQSHGDVQNVLSLSIISKSFISNVFDFFHGRIDEKNQCRSGGVKCSLRSINRGSLR